MNKQMERKSGQDRIAENVIYKRELNHSYMVLPCQDKDMAERYDYRIMQHNRIGGLLPCSLRYLDGEELLYYDITSRQPVSRLFESRPAGENQVRSFFLQLYETLDRMEAYLLGDGGILLDPELIYADPETFQMGFCVVPGRKEDFNSQLSLFLQYLMKNIDHRDRVWFLPMDFTRPV